MTRIGVVVLILVLAGATFPGGADEYPRDYFRSPIGIPIVLSGTFAELRSNHFHSGLDIKTNAKPGYRVYAAADGHISRIKVSPTGFGNALYVRHPNGFTTVYAHLQSFSAEVKDYVKDQQYRARSFAVDLYPDPSLFEVSKGEVIALSGNSGGSQGPHLHFEIRDSATEWPLNPLLFGLKLSDTKPPQIRNVKVYAIGAESAASVRFANGRVETVSMSRPLLIRAKGNGRSFELDGVKSITARGTIGFGIETRDYHNGSRSRLGPYRVSLSADQETIFEYVAEKFSFSNTRYINAHVDYAERKDHKRWVQRSYLLAGNRLPSYRNVVNGGFVDAEDGRTVRMRYEVADINGNDTWLSFDLVGSDELARPPTPSSEGQLVPFGEDVTFSRDGFRADIPAGAFYEDTRILYSVSPADEEAYSRRHAFHEPSTAVHNRIDIAIEAESLPSHLQDQVALAYVDDEGDVSLQSTTYRDGWVSARIRTLGEYFVSVDTVAPRIRPINIHDGKNMGKSGNIRFKIWDSETGVDSYEGLVDGKWVLFEYDPKTRMLRHHFDGRVGRGSHVLRLRVTDAVGNETVFESRFTR
jgi:hypothetical protein